MAIFCVMTSVVFADVANWWTLFDKTIFQTFMLHFCPTSSMLSLTLTRTGRSDGPQLWTFPLRAMLFPPVFFFPFFFPLFLSFFFSWQDFASRFSDTRSIAVIYDLVKNGEIIYFRATWSTKALEKKPAMERLGGGVGGAQVDFRRAEKDQSWE